MTSIANIDGTTDDPHMMATEEHTKFRMDIEGRQHAKSLRKTVQTAAECSTAYFTAGGTVKTVELKDPRSLPRGNLRRVERGDLPEPTPCLVPDCGRSFSDFQEDAKRGPTHLPIFRFPPRFSPCLDLPEGPNCGWVSIKRIRQCDYEAHSDVRSPSESFRLFGLRRFLDLTFKG